MPRADITIRPSTPADEPAVSALLSLSYSKLMPKSYEPAVLAELLSVIGKANPSLLASGTYYLAETGHGDVIGAGGWTKQRPGEGGCQPGLGHLRHFATHPSWIRHGVGRAIFDRCVLDARSRGITRFECYSGPNTVDFYEKLGFKALRRIDVPLHRKPGAANGLVMKAVLMECWL